MRKNITWHTNTVTKKERSMRKEQKAYIIWFTGLSASGKSSLANALELKLYNIGYHTYLLDGDNLRHGINSDLGFDKGSREENIRRVGEIAKLFVDSGTIVLASFISPYVQDRKKIRDLVEDDEFIEIFVDVPFETCKKRDPKGLYRQANDGKIQNFTAIDDTYETPLNPEIYLDNAQISIEENIEKILHYLTVKGLLSA